MDFLTLPFESASLTNGLLNVKAVLKSLVSELFLLLIYSYRVQYYFLNVLSYSCFIHKHIFRQNGGQRRYEKANQFPHNHFLINLDIILPHILEDKKVLSYLEQLFELGTKVLLEFLYI